MTANTRWTRQRLGLTEEEADKAEKFGKELAVKAAVSAALYPLAHTKTLFQLGYEPFPLSTGKSWFVFKEAYFLPNVFSYGRSFVNKFGVSALYNGVGAHVLSNAVGGSVAFGTAMYLDRYFPELGGKPINLGKEERELTLEESSRRLLRTIIRDITARTVATIAARPFTVIMIRKVAQVVGGEMKYTSVIASLYVIGNEEGPAGFFRGLVPQLIAEVITIVGVHTLILAIERGINRFEAEHKDDQDLEAASTFVRKSLHLAAPFLINAYAYPYTVVSTVMAVTGSGLAVSMLPYSPAFGSWQDAWNYLKPIEGLKRGARVLFREHTGAVTVGIDQQLYAANKHFV